MKKVIISLFLLAIAPAFGAQVSNTFQCGPGYVLESHKDIDGIDAKECQKLWCRDLETGKVMGKGKNPASGYKSTSAPMELCDANDNCVMCWGDRKWCSGQPTGIWDSEQGIYTRNGSAYQSYQKGSCFTWRLEKPECDEGLTAILQNGEWVCAEQKTNNTVSRSSAVRRTGGLRRSIR